MQTKKMTVGSPIKLIFSFALPLMVGNVFQQLYTVVDTIVVGQALGVNALAAVGAVDWLNWMMLGIIQGLTQGFGVILAQRFGAEDENGLRHATANATYLSVVFAVILTIIGLLIARPVLVLLRTPDTIIDMSMSYLVVAFLGIPVIFAYNFLAAILRALGNSKAPLQAMVVACAVNVVLDILFVMGFHWGIRGAAIATVIAQVVSAVYCFWKLTAIPVIRIDRASMGVDMMLCRQHLIMGLPMAFQNAIIAIGGMIVQFVVNGFGVIFLAGYTATNKLYGILEIAATSYGFAVSTYAGQNMGAGLVERIRKGTKAAVIIGIGTAIVIMIIMLTCGKVVLGWFISGEVQTVESTMQVAFLYLQIMSVCLPVLYVLHVLRSCIQGMGNTVLPMLSGVAEFVMRTGAVLILPPYLGEVSVFYSEVLAWIGADIVLVVSYFYCIRKVARMMK